MDKFMDINQSFYLGRTMIPYGNNASHNIFSLHSTTSNRMLANKYITIVGKNLDFSITTPKPVVFFHKNAAVEGGTVFGKDIENIVTGLFCQQDMADEIMFSDEDYEEILSLVRTEGNFVFYHPDSL